MVKQICVRLPVALIESLRRIARQRSAREDRDVSWVELLALGGQKVVEQEGQHAHQAAGR